MPTTINKTGIAAGKKLSKLCLCHLFFSDFLSEQKWTSECTFISLSKPIKQISAYTDDVRTTWKIMYCENENNQNATFFLFKNSECFWIKFELCLEITFYDMIKIRLFHYFEPSKSVGGAKTGDPREKTTWPPTSRTYFLWIWWHFQCHWN